MTERTPRARLSLPRRPTEVMLHRLSLFTLWRSGCRYALPIHTHGPVSTLPVQLNFKRELFAHGRRLPIAMESGHLHEDFLLRVLGHHEAKAPIGVPFLQGSVESGCGCVHG